MGINVKRKKRKRTGLKLIALLVLIICVVVLNKGAQLNTSYVKKEKIIDNLTEQILDANEETAKIEEKRAFMKTKKYIEELAREGLGLRYPNEVIFEPEE